MNEKKDSVVNRLTEDPEAFQTIADAKKVVCESNRPPHDLECASSELKAVEEAHDKLVAEKNELILTLESKTSMAKVMQINFIYFSQNILQDVISKTERLENMNNDLQSQVNETNAKIKAENDAHEELKQSEKKSLAENEILKEHARTLNCQLERYEELKKKRDEMIKKVMNVQTEKAELSGLTTNDEFLPDHIIINEVKKEADHFCEIQGEIQDSVITLRHNIKDELKATRNAVFEMEKINSKMTESVMTKAIQDMTSRLKKVKEMKMKRTKQLEEIQNSFDKLGDAKETGSSNVDDIIDLTKLNDDPGEYDYSHEETLSKIRQHHEDVLSDFE